MSKNTQISELINYLSFDGSGNIFFNTVSAAGSETGKILVSDNGTVKYRTPLELLAEIGAVDTTTSQTIAGVKTFTGTVAGITKAMVGLTNAEDTSDADKPVSTAGQTALDLKANIAGPTFTGTPAAPTASAGTNTTQLATTAFVTTGIANIVDSSPATLDTLNELAAALGDDPNFATTVATSIGTKQPQLSGTGFVKTTGTTVSYDSSTYLTTTTAGTTYLPLAGGIMTGDIQMGNNQNRIIKFRTASAWDYSLKGINDDFFITDNPGLNYLGLYYNGGGNNRYASLMGGVLNVYATGSSTFSGAISGTSATFSGALSGTSATFSGNVGINNTIPSSFYGNASQLVVGDGSTSRGMTIYSSAAADGQIFFADGTTGADQYRGMLRYEHSSDALVFFTNATEKLRISSGGAIEIKGSSTTLYAQGFITNDNSIFTIGSSVSASVDKPLALQVGGTNRLTISSEGNVGIGITSPTSYNSSGDDLVLGSTSNLSNGLSIVSPSSGDARGNIYFADGTSGSDQTRGFITYKHNINSMLFGTNDNLALTISSGGNIAMGAPATGTAPLHVKYANGSYGAEATSGIISHATSGRGTMRIRSDADDPAELFFDIDGAIRWDISVRTAGESHIMNWYPQAASPALNNVSSHVMSLTQAGDLGISGALSVKGANYIEMATFTAATGSTSGIITNSAGYITSFTAIHNSNSAVFSPVANGIKFLKAGLVHITSTQDFRSTGTTGYAYVKIRKNGGDLAQSLSTNSNNEWDMLNSTVTTTVTVNDIIQFYYGGTFLSMDAGSWSQYSFMWSSS